MKYLEAEKGIPKMRLTRVRQFLSRPYLMRLAFNGADGYPRVHPVWFLHKRGRLYVGMGRRSLKARSLRTDERCYFTIDIQADPERGLEHPAGIRGKATARLIDDSELAVEITKEQLLHYMGTLRGKIAKWMLEYASKDMVVAELKPLFLATWDYSRLT